MVVGLARNQWKSLVEATGLGEELDQLATRLRLTFDKEGDRFRARREIARIFEPWFATRMLAEVRRVFEAHGVMGELEQDLQLIPLSNLSRSTEQADTDSAN